MTVTLVDENGATIDWYSIEKQVIGDGGCSASPANKSTARSERSSGFETSCRQVPANLTARLYRRFVRGEVKSEEECQPGREVTHSTRPLRASWKLSA